MTQTCETAILPTPARRRAAAALPVLIEIPNIAVAAQAPRVRARRRRLRREVRLAGYALLAIFPLSLAVVSVGSDRLRPLSTGRTAAGPAGSDPVPNPTRPAPLISLA